MQRHGRAMSDYETGIEMIENDSQDEKQRELTDQLLMLFPKMLIGKR